jgi:glyoxylase-like metal-dependent hydrolase (beta-lactamase superfamily II)
MKIYNVAGNTYYFKTKYADIPFYKLNDKEIVMFDSGLFEESKLVQEVLDEYNFTVRAIICSHSHVDHVGNNSWIRQKYNAEVIMTEAEGLVCDSEYNLKAYILKGSYRCLEKRYASMVCKTDRKIGPDDTYVDIDGHKFEIVRLYGHTFFHIGIITPDDVFYVGDCLMSEEEIANSKLAYMIDVGLDLQSKEIVRNRKCKKYILAHSGVYDDVDRIIDLNIQNLESQAGLLIDIINRPMSMSEIVQEGIKKLNITKTVKTFIVTERILTAFVEYLFYSGIIKLEIIGDSLKYVPAKHGAMN